MLISLAWIIAGLVLLTVGADRLIAGAVRLSLRLGITPLIIGLTVVAFGTSAPELFVSLQASLNNTGDIAMGNIIGSNIFNLSIILGIAALSQPIEVKSQLIRQDIPVMIAATLLFYVMSQDMTLSRWEGGTLFFLLVMYILLMIRLARRGGETELIEEIEHHMPAKAGGSVIVDGLWIAAGIGLLVLGGNWLVSGAVDIAKMLGVSEALIGLTIVAAGTSLPELATSIVAAIKKESDIAVGNVVGSNIFNLLCIGGLAPLVKPFAFPDVEPADFLVMIALTLVLLPITLTARRIGRVEGMFFLGCYAAYLYYIWPTPV